MTHENAELRRPKLLIRPDREPHVPPVLSRKVPQWIKDELENVPQLCRRENLIKVLESPIVTRRTWDTIFREEEARLERNGVTGYSAALQSFLAPLANFIDRGVAGPCQEVALSKKQRDELSEQLIKSSERLLGALAPLQGEEYFEWREALINAVPTAGDPDDRLAALHVVLNPSVAVRLIAQAAEIWRTPTRRSSPHMPRPNARNAGGLFLLRTLSAGFRRRYGKPLLAPAQQVAGVFHKQVLTWDPAGVRTRVNGRT